METKRLMLKGGPMQDHPGCWKITGKIEGESDSWSVIRKPDGTFWEIASTDYFPKTGGMIEFKFGDQILNKKTIAECEEFYFQLQEKSIETQPNPELL